MNHRRARSDKFATKTTEPTMTDQSGANDTDINIIVKRYGVYGTAPGAARQPLYQDVSNIPIDLADKIRQIRAIPDLQRQLPPELARLTIDELVGLTPDELKARLTPPADPTPEPKENS